MPCEALRGSVSDDRAKDGCLYLLAILCTKIWATKLGGIIGMSLLGTKENLFRFPLASSHHGASGFLWEKFFTESCGIIEAVATSNAD